MKWSLAYKCERDVCGMGGRSTGDGCKQNKRCTQCASRRARHSRGGADNGSRSSVVLCLCRVKWSINRLRRIQSSSSEFDASHSSKHVTQPTGNLRPTCDGGTHVASDRHGQRTISIPPELHDESLPTTSVGRVEQGATVNDSREKKNARE
jgi:hypothetical protein